MNVRTGRLLREEHKLLTGERVLLRHIQPSDAPLLKAAFDTLSPETRYRRFFGGAKALDDATLHYLTCVDGIDHVALVALMESPDMKSERGVGVARFVRLRERKDAAEIAVVVVDDMQRKGLGALLLRTAVLAATERNVAYFRAEVLSGNAPMLAILDEVDAKRRASPNGAIAFEIALSDGGRSLQNVLRAAAAQIATFIRRFVRYPPT